MKITQWLGYNEDASQYLLRPGELRVLNNLQSRRPGMLITRKGLRKIYGRYDNESIIGLYRRATILGDSSDFFWLQKVKAKRELTIEEILANTDPYEFRWVIKRVYGDQARVIDTLDLSPNGVSEIKNFCIAEDRHGRVFIFYGHGVRPRMYRPGDLANVAIDLGLDPPKSQPSIIPTGRGSFVESVDVRFSGGGYYEAPELTVSGGDPDRPARLQALVQYGNVVGVEVIDGGANYKSAPTISVNGSKKGSGFKAFGNFSTAAYTLYGFKPSAPATITTSVPFNQPAATETYGTSDGTENQKIMYFSRQPVTEESLVSYANRVMTLSSVSGIQVGDVLTVEPSDSFFQIPNAITVQSIDASASQITHSGTSVWTPTANTAYRVRVVRNSQASADAVYDSQRRRYTAAIPATWAAGGGKPNWDTTSRGAIANLEFSPMPLGYALNDQNPEASVEGTNKQFQTYYLKRKADEDGPVAFDGYTPYLYGDYWSGSDYNVQGSKENAEYGGLQASGSRFVRGYSGTISNKRADVYWPDYSQISVWLCTGAYSDSINQWSRVDVPVITTTNQETGVTSKTIRFRVPPTANGRKIASVNNNYVRSELTRYNELPNAEYPEVELTLVECPDSWIASGDQCLPTDVKEASENRLPWWVPGTGVSRPLVSIAGVGEKTADASAVTITDPGGGWEKDTLFSFRIYQGNSYAQKVDYNTAVVEDSLAGGHQISSNSQYVEFRLRATAPDDQTPHGPPQVLIEPATIAASGDGWSSGETAQTILMCRTIGQPASSARNGPSLSWVTTALETLSSASTGSISSITIQNRGINYFSDPTIMVRGGGKGYGLRVEPTVSNGRIQSVRIIDAGLNYNDKPELYTESRDAKLNAVMRPAMRGRYRCAYRFVDRSETVLKTATVSRGDAANILVFDNAEGVKPDMVLEGTVVPWNSIIKSVNGNAVELNQEVVNLAQPHQLVWSAAAAQNSKTGSVVALVKNGKLDPGGEVLSADSEYKLLMGADGNLSLCKKRIVPAGRFTPETIVYDTLIWDTGTSGNPGAVARLRGNGSLAVVAADGTTVLWQNSAPGAETLELTNGGLLATYTGTPTATVTVRDMSKPVSYSDFSPIADVNAGPNEDMPHCSEMVWSLPGVEPPARADLIEFWRTSAEQSLVFYRVDAYGKPTSNGVEIIGRDTLTDEELFDADRPFYAAMPVVLPNGNVNAYRFGSPRTDMSVGVAFQDRLWMGVSTSGDGANTLYYSEFDEFESLPDVNELPIQNNQKSTDVLTALVPFGSMLLAMQHTHTYSVAYNTDPSVDASIQMMSHRGCLHQRCWDIHENVMYAADESGIYGMSRGGEVQDISMPIRDFFVSEVIDFSKRDTFFLQADPRTHILRFFCTLKTNPTDTPSLALCYDIQAQSWWTESYPNSFTSACTGRPSSTRVNTILLGGVDGNLYEITGEQDHSNYCLTDSEVRDGGSGYRESPTISIPNCKGASVKGVVSEGRLVDVVIQDAGWDANWGIGLLAENGSPLSAADGRELKGVEYAPIKLDVGPPEPGGIQAEAYVNFSVTPTVRRNSTVAINEAFVRLERERFRATEPEFTLTLQTVDGEDLLFPFPTNQWKTLRTEPPPVEIGMEAVGDYVPLNSFVSRIDGRDIYLAHPDGTPVKMLFGEPRTNEPMTPEGFKELGGTKMVVQFFKPFNTNIPFRMATGYMQLLNDGVVKNGDRLMDRSVTLVYTPTAGTKEVEILERFNGRDELRANAMRRDRGGPGGFYHRQDSASTVLNTSRNASALAFATGVAKATFASRSLSDMTGEDQYIQIEVYGRPTQSSKWKRDNFWIPLPDAPDPYSFTLHNMTVNGVTDNGQ